MKNGLLLAGTFAFVLGCGTEDAGPEIEAKSAAETLAEFAPLAFEHENGRTFIRLEAVEPDTSPPLFEPVGGGDEEDPTNPLEMSVEELADAMRAVTVRDGYYYVEAEADIDMAKTILDNLHRDITTAAYEPMEVGEPEIWEDEETGEIIDGSSTGQGVSSVSQGIVVGVDNRAAVNNNFPWRTSVALQKYMDRETGRALDCSGIMIGRNIMLTAAHCVFNTGTNQEKHPIALPGYDAQSYKPRPAGPYLYGSASTDDKGPGEECMDVFYPKGWVDAVGANGNRFWDYAVITFDRCSGTEPGNLTGFMPITTKSPPWGRSGITNGYPGDKTPGVTDMYSNSKSYMYPFTSDLVPPDRYNTNYDGCTACWRHNLDTKPGQSGSGLWYVTDEIVSSDKGNLMNGRMTFAIHSAQTKDGKANLARDVDAFVVLHVLKWAYNVTLFGNLPWLE